MSATPASPMRSCSSSDDAIGAFESRGCASGSTPRTSSTASETRARVLDGAAEVAFPPRACSKRKAACTSYTPMRPSEP